MEKEHVRNKQPDFSLTSSCNAEIATVAQLLFSSHFPPLKLDDYPVVGGFPLIF